MRRPWMATFRYFVLVCTASLSATSSIAVPPVTREAVVMQLHTNFVASTSVCSLFSFVSATPPQQPAVGATLCAFGGPFGGGIVGTVVTTAIRHAGQTIQLDRTVSFGGTDVIYVRAVFQLLETVSGGSGGLNYFSGTWDITGGTGAFGELRGQGTLVNAVVSNDNVPPPPQFADESLVGWVHP